MAIFYFPPPKLRVLKIYDLLTGCLFKFLQ